MKDSFKHLVAKELDDQARKVRILKKISEALEEDVNVGIVLDELEREIILHAFARHSSLVSLYKGLKMPKTTFFQKKNRYFN